MTTAQSNGLAKAHAANREAANARLKQREREARKRINRVKDIASTEHLLQLTYLSNRLAKRIDVEDEKILVSRRDEILSHYERRLGFQHNPVEDEPTVLGVAA